MVLMHHTVHFRVLSTLLIVFSLNACSVLDSQQKNNRSPTPPIIPVQSTPDSQPAQKSAITVKKPNSAKPATQQVDSVSIDSEPEKSVRVSPSDVLGSVLSLAKKAIENKQWLRAQRHLEHALRLAPKDAYVFLLYAEVYKGLSVESQEINMLKRALFLAKPNSEIYRMAKAKLEELTE